MDPRKFQKQPKVTQQPIVAYRAIQNFLIVTGQREACTETDASALLPQRDACELWTSLLAKGCSKAIFHQNLKILRFQKVRLPWGSNPGLSGSNPDKTLTKTLKTTNRQGLVRILRRGRIALRQCEFFFVLKPASSNLGLTSFKSSEVCHYTVLNGTLVIPWGTSFPVQANVGLKKSNQ